MSCVVGTTERLELRRFCATDAAGFFALNADPEVLRHTGDVPFASVDSARRFLLAYDHYRRHGFGRWSLYLRESGEYVGFCGLRRGGDGAVDLGFRIARRHWGRGLATEAGRAALELGFGHHGLDEVIGRAMPANHASHRVLARLGFVERDRVRDDHGAWIVHVLTRAGFARTGR